MSHNPHSMGYFNFQITHRMSGSIQYQVLPLTNNQKAIASIWIIIKYDILKVTGQSIDTNYNIIIISLSRDKNIQVENALVQTTNVPRKNEKD